MSLVQRISRNLAVAITRSSHPLVKPSTHHRCRQVRPLYSSSKKHKPLQAALAGERKPKLSASAEKSSLTVTFGAGDTAEFAYPFLRDNCQCPHCYDQKSYTRILTLDDWDINDTPQSVHVDGSEVVIQWESGHQSTYSKNWLLQRTFRDEERKARRQNYLLNKVSWGPDFTVPKFDYNEIINDEKIRLDWLVTMEKLGLTMVQNAPREQGAAIGIINKVGFVKPTHYGVGNYLLQNVKDANTLAYTDRKLGMHNDLPYYNHVPGIIFLHCITQFEGKGGENALIDGIYLASYIKKHHPEEYRFITETPVYFWNKGVEQYGRRAFHKILNTPLIQLDAEGQVKRVNNSQLRDSFLDIPVEKVGPWYNALKLYNTVMEDQALRLKLDHGEMLVMDNTRLLHGRSAYNSTTGKREMDQTYLDWDEALCARRVLQEQFQIDLE